MTQLSANGLGCHLFPRLLCLLRGTHYWRREGLEDLVGSTPCSTQPSATGVGRLVYYKFSLRAAGPGLQLRIPRASVPFLRIPNFILKGGNASLSAFTIAKESFFKDIGEKNVHGNRRPERGTPAEFIIVCCETSNRARKNFFFGQQCKH